MAPPPSKRQKRRTIVSSDEEEDTDASEKYRDSPVSNSVLWKNGVKLARRNGTTARSLPTRSRTKPNTIPKSRSATPATPLSPKSSSEDPPHKPRVTREAQKRGSLHAYFNAANKVPLSKKEVQPKVETPTIGIEEEDFIEDDSLDELHQVSSTQNVPASTIDSRKGLVVPSRSRASSAGLKRPPNGSQRFLRAGKASGKDASSQAATQEDKVDLRPWAEKYTPAGIEELMVHKKKVADVRTWLERAFLGREHKVSLRIFASNHDLANCTKRLLILKGPSGAGKTATISTLATAMDFAVTEWGNPINTDYSSEGYLSVSAQFEDFLGRSGKFDSLTFTGDGASTKSQRSASPSLLPESAKQKVILLEEFPSTFSSASAALRSFRSNILQHLAVNISFDTVTPLVLIITETHQAATISANDSFTAHRLLGPDILTHPSTTVIEFNPVAATLLTKALELVIHKEARHSGRRRIPGPAVLKKLAEVGDVRSAIGSLEFLCLRANDGDDWGGRVASRGKKSASALTNMERASLEMVTQREASLGIFHAVGKVVYNKRDEPTAVDHRSQTPEHLRQYVREMVSQVSIDDLLNETGTDISTFIAALHENYILSCESPSSFTNAFNGCIDALSDTDLLSLDKGVISNGFGRGSSDSLRQDEFAFHIAVRGLLFTLPYPVKRRALDRGKGNAFKMAWPTSLRVGRRREEVEGLVEAWGERQRVSASLTGEPKAADLSPSDVREQTHREPFRINISSSKDELLLERLPYAAKISPRQNQLEIITKFGGIDKPTDDVPDEDGEDSARNKSWTNNKRNTEVAEVGIPTEAGTKKLYLSDDDIEDN